MVNLPGDLSMVSDEMLNQIFEPGNTPNVSVSPQNAVYRSVMAKVVENLSLGETRAKLHSIGFSYPQSPTNETVRQLRSIISSIRERIPSDRLSRYGIPSANKIIVDKQELEHFLSIAPVELEPN